MIPTILSIRIWLNYSEHSLIIENNHLKYSSSHIQHIPVAQKTFNIYFIELIIYLLHKFDKIFYQ